MPIGFCMKSLVFYCQRVISPKGITLFSLNACSKRLENWQLIDFRARICYNHDRSQSYAIIIYLFQSNMPDFLSSV